jgi:hypothetical protein
MGDNAMFGVLAIWPEPMYEKYSEYKRKAKAVTLACVFTSVE